MLLVADNLSGARPLVAEALKNLDPRPLRDLARECARAGAKSLDINPGHLPARRRDRMVFMVETVQEAVDLPLVLDSAQPEVLALGLEACRRKPILNGLSLAPERIDQVIPLAASHDVDLVVLLMDDHSVVPQDLDGRIALALELAEHCRAGGLALDRLIFDPLLPFLSKPNAFAEITAVVETVRYLSTGAIFQTPVRTMIGLSNLRSGFRRTLAADLETTCLTLLAGAGLSLVLADVLAENVRAASSLINQMT